MTTGSTKSNRKKQPKPAPAARPKTETSVREVVPAAELSQRSWLVGSIVIMAVGAALRLYNLPLVPFHHDEGVNGNFLVHLVRDGFYHYDPENYHGPTLYYFSAAIPWIFRFLFGVNAQNSYGLNTITIRLVPALFGLGTIWLVLTLHRRLGRVASLAAALLLAISPGAVYLSRYFIHESLFVFFTLGIVVAALRYYDEGQWTYLVLAWASAGLLFATKETWFISVGVLLIALLATPMYLWLSRKLGFGAGADDRRKADGSNNFSAWWTETSERSGGISNLAIWSAVGALVAVGIAVLFYSSFLSNWQGVSDALKTLKVWSKTGQTAHVHSNFTYVFTWLPYQEGPLLVLGMVGTVLVALKPKNSFALYSALWAIGIIAAYSIVPYKTPWLMLSFLVPLALISGYAFERFYERVRELGFTRGIVVVLLLACLLVFGGAANLALAAYKKPTNMLAAIPGYQTIDLNFLNYDNDDEYYVYVYAHTHRDLLKLIDHIDQVAKRGGTGDETGITIVSPDYWPLPWYFRDYKRVGYYGRMSSSTEPVIIASQTQLAEVQAELGDRYRQVGGKFKLRPGVELLLFVRKDVAAP